MNLIYVLASMMITFLCFIVAMINQKDKTLLKILTTTMTLFVIEYLVFAIFFLWLDIFLVDFVLIGMFALNVLIISFQCKKIQEGWEGIRTNFGISYLILIGIIIMLIPMVFVKSEDMRTSGDMGMYFAKLTDLISDDTRVVKQLAEMGTISDSVDEGVLKIQDQLMGIYIRGVGDNGYYIYDYHSLPTWVTFMALFAKMFDVYHASQALTFLYVLSVLLCYSICKEIGKGKISKYVSVVFFALCPIIIFVAKCTLTEMSYVTVLLAAIYFIVENEECFVWLAGVCFGLMGFLHITTFAYMPGIYLCLFMMVILLKEKKYGWINILNCIGFIGSLFYGHFISYAYTKAQLTRWGALGDALYPVVLALTIIFGLGILVQLIFMYLIKDTNGKLRSVIMKVFPWILVILVLVVIVGCIWNGYNLAFTDRYASGDGTWASRSVYANKGWASLSYLNVFNIMKAQGYVLLPVVFGYIVFRKNKNNITQNILIFMLLYAMLLYTFVNVDTPNNYYSSRYFVHMIIPVLTILSATIMDDKIWCKAMMAWCVIYALRFDYLFVFRASYMGQYDLWKDVSAQIPAYSVVLVREEDIRTNQLLVNNLRELNNNLVYNYANVDEVLGASDEKEVYLISQEKIKKYSELLLMKKYDIMYSLGGVNAEYMTEETHRYSERIFVYKIK